MTVLVPETSALPAASPVDELRRRQPALAAIGLLLILALLPLGLAAILDPRTVAGAPIWDKPVRFALALGVYALTLAFFAGWIAPEARRSRLVRVTVALGVAALAYEQGWISFQAARGQASHFNMSGLVNTIAWALMGIGALLLTFMSPVIGWQIWRHPVAGLAPALRAAAALGLGLTFPLTLLTAGWLAVNGGYYVGEAGGASGLLLLGWSREVGDLRVAHFFAAHALHFVPLAAALALPFTGSERMGPAAAIAAAYTLFVLAVFGQALLGQPFFPMLG